MVQGASSSEKHAIYLNEQKLLYPKHEYHMICEEISMNYSNLARFQIQMLYVLLL